MVEPLRLALLGGLRLHIDDVEIGNSVPAKAAALLSYLAVTGRPHSRAALSGLLWADAPEAVARASLRQALFSLNKQVAPYLVVARDTVAFNRAAPYWLDVEHFEAQITTTRRAGTPDIARLREAVALYHGDLLAGFYVRDAPEFEEWLTGQRERLRQLATHGLHMLVADAVEREADARGIDDARRLLALDPWHEDTHRQLMLLLALSGQREAAIVQYERCRRILAEELDVEPAVETTLLAEQIRTGVIVPGVGSTPRRHNLPVQRLALIGRDQDVAAVTRLLRRTDVGLLALVGPGGVGKTRLAIEVAAELCQAFTDGVWFVDLAPITDSELVAVTIARALGVQPAAGQPLLLSLLDSMKHKQLLLVLDNCEQVIDAAPLIGELLAAVAGLKVLVTSRVALPVYGGYEYPVPPLGLPEVSQLPSVQGEAALEEAPAVALFVERAQAVQPTFALTATNTAAVAEICARLDGLPLAIELAAARMKLFAPQALLARLADRFAVLKGGPRDRPERQRTMRNTIAWSYDLLAPSEQALFRRLAAFVGGFTLEAVEAVAGAAGDLDVDVLDGVEALVGKQLVRPLRTSTGRAEAEARFGMLETIREFGLEELARSGETTAIRQRHMEFYLQLSETAAPELMRTGQEAWLARLEAEHDNLRAALHWAEERGQVEALLRLGGALGPFWLVRGHHSEGWRWLEAGLAAAEQTGSMPPPLRAQAALSAASLAFWQADYTRAIALAETSLALYQALQDPSGIAQALYALGSVAWSHNDFDRALPLLEQSLSVARELGNTWITMQAGARLGIALSVQGNYPHADPLLEQSLTLARQHGDSQLIATLLMPLGVSRWQHGALERAAALFQEALVRLQYSGGRWFMPHPLIGLAAVAAREQPLRAARLLGAAKALGDAVGTSIPPALQAQHDAMASAVRSQVGQDAYCHAWEEGQAWPLEQVIDYALGRSLQSC